MRRSLFGNTVGFRTGQLFAVRLQDQMKGLGTDIRILIAFFFIIPLRAVALGINGTSAEGYLGSSVLHIKGIFSVIGNGKASAVFIAHIQETLHIKFGNILCDRPFQRSVRGFCLCMAACLSCGKRSL